MREIVFDTETTGLDPVSGHRLVEVACIELVNRIPSGQTFQRYINPERDVPAEAFAVHGLSGEFLKDKPVFASVADDLLAFIADAPLVAHNALFDLGFLNAELERAGRAALPRERIVDTLVLARRRHPGGPNSLDNLCGRYGINNAHRAKHGALLDAELLAEVYVELIGGRQASLTLVESGRGLAGARRGPAVALVRSVPLAPRWSPAEQAAHASFIATLGGMAIWLEYDAAPEPAPASGGITIAVDSTQPLQAVVGGGADIPDQAFAGVAISAPAL